MNIKKIALGVLIGFILAILFKNVVIFIEEAEMRGYPVVSGSGISYAFSPDNLYRNWQASRIKKVSAPTREEREEAYIYAIKTVSIVASYSQGKLDSFSAQDLIVNAYRSIKKAEDLGCDMGYIKEKFHIIEKMAAEHNVELALKNFDNYVNIRTPAPEGTLEENIAKVRDAITLVKFADVASKPYQDRFLQLLPYGARLKSIPMRHVVKSGETFSGICQKIMGDGSRKQWEAEAYRLKLDNPDLIRTGEEFIFFKPMPTDYRAYNFPLSLKSYELVK